jgi:hypothetical protein
MNMTTMKLHVYTNKDATEEIGVFPSVYEGDKISILFNNILFPVVECDTNGSVKKFYPKEPCYVRVMYSILHGANRKPFNSPQTE